jgi:hypothetical protein
MTQVTANTVVTQVTANTVANRRCMIVFLALQPPVLFAT